MLLMIFIIFPRIGAVYAISFPYHFFPAKLRSKNSPLLLVNPIARVVTDKEAKMDDLTSQTENTASRGETKFRNLNVEAVPEP